MAVTLEQVKMITYVGATLCLILVLYTQYSHNYRQKGDAVESICGWTPLQHLTARALITGIHYVCGFQHDGLYLLAELQQHMKPNMHFNIAVKDKSSVSRSFLKCSIIAM